MVPIWVAAKDRLCIAWSTNMISVPGCRDMMVKRITAAADPIMIRPTPELRPTCRPR